MTMFTVNLNRWLTIVYLFMTLISRTFCNICDTRRQHSQRIYQGNWQDREEIVNDCNWDSFPLELPSMYCNYGICIKTLKIRSLNTRVLSSETFDSPSISAINMLYMEKLSINNIESSAFSSLHQIVNIYLSNNDLTTINDGTFSELNSLEFLDLSVNKLTNLSRHSLIGTFKLKYLNLSSNFLTVFDILSISSSNQMTLDLSFNKLHEFPFEHGAGRIENLNLSYNLLTDIIDCFPTFTVTTLNNNKLKSTTNISCFSKNERSIYLNLGFNKLSEIKPGLFDKMTNLQQLFLDNNNITSLPTDIFARLHSLKTLNISHNHIKHFQHGLFEHLEELSTLDVSSNELSDVTSYLISLTNLIDLRIDHNCIHDLDAEQLLHDLPILKNISLDGNNFFCSDLIEIFRKLRAHNISVPYGDTKSADHIHGISCNEDTSLSPKVEYGSDIVKKIEKAVLQKLADYEQSMNTNNKSLTEFFNKSFKNSDFYGYLENLNTFRTYRFNESEFVNYFDKDFKNSTFFKYLEHLKENETSLADFNKSFYNYFNKDFKNSSFVKYFESIKNTDEVFNDNFIKSKMFNFFNKGFQNSNFYKYIETLKMTSGTSRNHTGENGILNFEKLVSNSNSDFNDSHLTVIIIFLAILIFIVSSLSLVVFKMYFAFLRNGKIGQENVELTF